jgi:hypothetical protein
VPSARSRIGRLLGRERETALPVADIRGFDASARRTRLVGLGLAAALVAAALVAVLASPGHAGRRFLPAGTAGIVVLDVSSSIRPETYYRIEQELALISASRSRLGLVLFSDVAYEALPPGTPASELKPMLRFFAPPAGFDAQAPATDTQAPPSPWDQWFSAGTRISSGLFLAARMLQQQNVAHGAVILISDLADDPPDIEPLTEAVLLLQQLGASLEIVGLDPTRQNAEYFRRLLGTGALFQIARLPTSNEAQGKVGLTGSTPTWLLIAGALTIALLAIEAWWGAPFRWQRRHA